jgi:hypothetical protein
MAAPTPRSETESVPDPSIRDHLRYYARYA